MNTAKSEAGTGTLRVPSSFILHPSSFALYPWESIADVEREQAEAEIFADGEFRQWLEALLVDMELEIELGPVHNQPQQDLTAGMGELEFMAYTLGQLSNGDQPPTVAWSDEALAAIEDEPIGADFCRQPWLY
ncbi:MAG: hypothetical protein E6Q97_14225 [Desulfurellales bacterium]|nr:MAG: hypothetical protein E6Q97_14225 [Desulfurellales bacterium]